MLHANVANFPTCVCTPLGKKWQKTTLWLCNSISCWPISISFALP